MVRAKKLRTEGATDVRRGRRKGSGNCPIKKAEMLLPATIRALITLGVPEYFKPKFPVAYLFNVLRPNPPTTLELCEYIKCSDNKAARKVIEKFETLVQVEQDAVSLDHLIEAAKVDPAEILGVLTAEMFRQNTLRTQLIASFAAPRVMEAVITRATGENGHQDSKMLLQSVGAAPVPSNQKVTVFNSGSMAFNKQINVGGQDAAMRLEDIVRDMDGLDAVVNVPMLTAAPSDDDDLEEDED